MSSPRFVSPGAMAGNAIQEFLMNRALQDQKQQEDEFKRQRQLEESSRQAEMLKLQQKQEERIAAAQQRTMARQAQQDEIAATAARGAQNTLGVQQMIGERLSQGPVSPEEAQTIEGMAYGQGLPVPGVVQRAVTPPKRTVVETVGPGNKPVRRAVTEEELIAGVPEYQEPKGGDDVAPTLAPAALDMTARMYAKTGQLPPMGMGKQSAGVRQAIINRAAQYDPSTDTFGGGGAAPDIAGNKADYSANTQSLNQLTKNMSAVSAFEETARKNSAQLEDVLKRIPGQNTPRFLNTPLRSLATQMGSEDMAKFNAIRQSVQNEYARIITNPGLTGVMSDSARHEMETIMSGDATPAQIRAALQVLQQEAVNRKTSFEDQIGTLRGRIRGGTQSETPAAPAPNRKYYDTNGKPVQR